MLSLCLFHLPFRVYFNSFMHCNLKLENNDLNHEHAPQLRDNCVSAAEGDPGSRSLCSHAMQLRDCVWTHEGKGPGKDCRLISPFSLSLIGLLPTLSSPPPPKSAFSIFWGFIKKNVLHQKGISCTGESRQDKLHVGEMPLKTYCLKYPSCTYSL